MEIDKRYESAGLVIVKPYRPSAKAPGDPYGDACMIAERDWRKEYGARTLVWDTATWRSKVFLQMASHYKKFGQNIQFGTGGRTHTLPQKGDYGAAQSMMLEIRQILLEQPMHVIMVGHQHIAEYENEDGVVSAGGGFGLVGKASVATFGDVFNQYLRMYVEQKHAMIAGQVSQRRVMLQFKKGPLFDAGIRTTQDMPDTVEVPATLDGQRALWGQLLNYFRIPLDGSSPWLRMGIYAAPKVGKSQFVTSIPDALKPLVYIADDPGGEDMLSTFPEVLATPLSTPIGGADGEANVPVQS